MSDINHIPQTPEAVAYKLMQGIFLVEGKQIGYKRGTDKQENYPTREEILQTYKQCLIATKEPHVDTETNLSEAA